MKTNKLDQTIYNEILYKIGYYINGMKLHSSKNYFDKAYEYQISAKVLIELLEINMFKETRIVDADSKNFYHFSLEERYENLLKTVY